MTTAEIRKASRVRKALEKVIETPGGPEAENPVLKSLREQAAE